MFMFDIRILYGNRTLDANCMTLIGGHSGKGAVKTEILLLILLSDEVDKFLANGKSGGKFAKSTENALF